jgi:glycosyltransferase involved in cell wall biosynthesis
MHSLDFYRYLPRTRVPVLVTLHLPADWYPEEIFKSTRPNTFYNCVSASQRRSCPRSSLLLPTVPNGIDLSRFDPPRPKRKYVAALGRICPEKGFHLALDAARRARVDMLLAGEVLRCSWHLKYFKEEIAPRLNGRRRFIGAAGVERKRTLLSEARCLLVPSLVAETSSLVTMEAMASGTPVIAYPSGALTELIEDGRTGFLVKDEYEMAEAIKAVDSIDPEECRDVARERFSSTRMVRRYMDRYFQILDSGSSAVVKPLAAGGAMAGLRNR